MPNWKKVILSGSNAVLAEITASGNLSGSGTATASYGLFTGSFGGDGTNLNLSSNTSISTSPFPFVGDGIISGSLLISSSNVGGVSTASLSLQGSGSTIFSVQGSQGQLFSLTDDLLHDNLVVGDISGDTIFKVSGSGLVMIPVGNLTGSGTATASYGLFTGSFGGDGTNLNLANNTTITVATPTLNAVTTAGNTTTNNIEITGSLNISGSLIPGGRNRLSTNNVVIGRAAGENMSISSTSALDNTFIGAEAGNDLTSGNNNVLVGYKAGEYLTTSQDVIAIGKTALGADNTAGNALNYVIAIGTNAGGRLQGGIGDGDHHGIYIGRNAGINIDSNDGNRNNILIGHRNVGPSSQGHFGEGHLRIGQGMDSNAVIFPISASLTTGSVLIPQLKVDSINTANSASGTTLSVEGSGSTVFEVIGSEGTLFSVSDNLTQGSLFAVKDINGFPLLDVTRNTESADIVTIGQSDLLIDSGSLILTGSISVSGSVTNNLTASYAIKALSADTVTTAPSLDAVTTAGNITTNNINVGAITGSNLLITNTASISYFHTTYQSSSIIHASGSTKFGDTTDDLHQFTGSIESQGPITASAFKGDGSQLTNLPAPTLQQVTTEGNITDQGLIVSGSTIFKPTTSSPASIEFSTEPYSGQRSPTITLKNASDQKTVHIGHSVNDGLFELYNSTETRVVNIQEHFQAFSPPGGLSSGYGTYFGVTSSISPTVASPDSYVKIAHDGYSAIPYSILQLNKKGTFAGSGSITLQGITNTNNNSAPSIGITSVNGNRVVNFGGPGFVHAANVHNNYLKYGLQVGGDFTGNSSNMALTDGSLIMSGSTGGFSVKSVSSEAEIKTNDGDTTLILGTTSSFSYVTASAFKGDGSQLTNLNITTPTLAQVVTAGATAVGDVQITGSLVISQSYTAGDTDSTALRLIGSGSVSQSGIFEVEGSAGPLFSVQDGLDGVLMEVNNISGLPLLQVSSSNEVFINRGNLTSGVTTATASFAYFTGSFAGDGGGLTNLNVTTPDLDAVTTAGNTTANNITAGIISGSAFKLNNKSAVSFTTTNLNIGYDPDWTHINLGKQSTDEIRVNGMLKAQRSITASANISASGYVSASAFSGDGSGLRNLPSTNSFPFVGDAEITGSLIVSASHTSQSLSVIGSGSTVFDVIGSEGTLFSIDDDLDGIIFTANNRTGNPVLQASASGEVYIGSTPQSLYTTAVISSTAASVTHSLAIINTSSYDGAFFDYTAHSGSNARAGSVMSVWNGSNISFTETTTTDIGSTADLNIKTIISGSAARLVAYSPNAQYNIKTIIRAL